MHRIFIAVILFQLLSGAAVAAPISLLVGDNDGFGAGIPDGGDGSVITQFQQGNILDRREAGEAGSSNGAQLTDLYTFIFPTLTDPLFPFNAFLFDSLQNEGDDPRASKFASVIFPLTGTLLSGELVVDVLDYQSENYISADINGIGFDFGPPGNFSESSLRSFALTPEQIAEANLAQQVILNLALDVGFGIETSGDLLAFDFFRLDGELATSVIPVPAAVWLFGTALIGLVGFSRRKKAA